MGRTLLDKIWDAHTVRVEDGGRCVLYIDRQYIHEVTSPVAFAGLERRGVDGPRAVVAPAQQQPRRDAGGAGRRRPGLAGRA